jgi:hypothetical protein
MSNQPEHFSILSYPERQVTGQMFRFGFVLFFPLSMVARTGSLNMSQDLVARGIAVSNLTPNAPSLDAKPLVEAAVAYAAKNGVATVTADPGSYYFPSQRVVLAGAANVTLDFRNSDLNFASGATGAVECQNCSAVTLQNFTVDFPQLPFTQVSVTAVDAANRTLTFQIPAGWRAATEFTGDVRMFVFRNGAPLPQAGRLDGAKPVAGNVVQIANAGPWAQSTSLATIQRRCGGDRHGGRAEGERAQRFGLFAGRERACLYKNDRHDCRPGTGDSAPRHGKADRHKRLSYPGECRIGERQRDE